ncbi:hypothetical protein G9H72_20810, partial [Motilibacter sp. K478]|nr:hypothetical protein [Motilibacter aurantiacus]
LAVPTAQLPLVEAAVQDVRAAGRAVDLTLVGEDGLEVAVVRGAELEQG